MTPVTARDADEPKDCRRTIATLAPALREPWAGGAHPPDRRRVRTMGLQPQTRHQTTGRPSGLERRSPPAPGRPPAYGAEVLTVLWRVWKAAEPPCGKRLKALLPTWLPHYEAGYGRLEKTIAAKGSIHQRGADRPSAGRPQSAGQPPGRCGTKPGGILKPRSRSVRTTGTSPVPAFGKPIPWRIAAAVWRATSSEAGRMATSAAAGPATGRCGTKALTVLWPPPAKWRRRCPAIGCWSARR
jgi:hypothetical protein